MCACAYWQYLWGEIMIVVVCVHLLEVFIMRNYDQQCEYLNYYSRKEEDYDTKLFCWNDVVVF
jgi:hypothetical protein